MAAAAADPLEFGDTVTVLVDYSLAKRTAAKAKLHWLVQATLRARHDHQGPHTARECP